MSLLIETLLVLMLFYMIGLGIGWLIWGNSRTA
jgi:hypothetical protein